jgi:hypothetical protein
VVHHKRRFGGNALTARLRDLPGCVLAVFPTGVQAALMLAGAHVQSDAGLGGVCTARAAEADRSRASDHGGARYDAA